jgi:hypothetical protein
MWIVPAVMRGAEQQELYVSARGPRAEDARRDDSCFVEHQEVAAPQILWQIAERAVFDLSMAQHEQTGRIARSRRLLRDQAFRKLETIGCG